MSPTLLDKSEGLTMSPLFLGASAFLVLAYLIRSILLRRKKLEFPIVGSPNDAHFRDALIEGSAKVRTS